MLKKPWLPATLVGLAVVLPACGAAENDTSATAAKAGAAKDVPKFLSEAFPVNKTIGGKVEAGEQTLSSDPVSKPWKLCASLPNGSDPYWVGINYGLVTQAERRGASIQVLDAGGYDKLPNQISQLENCKNSGADAVLVGAISSEGIAGPVREIDSAGTPVVAVLNPVTDLPVVAQTAPALEEQGRQIGEWVREDAKDAGGTVQAAYFPGPAGADWTALQLKGFEGALKGSNVDIVAVKHGETNPSTQLSLVENTLKAFPDVRYIAGNAVAADTAVGAVAQAGKAEDIKIGAVYVTDAVSDKVRSGSIAAVANDRGVIIAALSVDLAIDALEGKEISAENIAPAPFLMTRENAPSREEDPSLAPVGYKAKFSSN
jgi:protein TorT